MLILPDEIPARPYAVAMEAAMLAPKSEVSIYPWKEPPEGVSRHMREGQSVAERLHRMSPTDDAHASPEASDAQ